MFRWPTTRVASAWTWSLRTVNEFITSLVPKNHIAPSSWVCQSMLYDTLSYLTRSLHDSGTSREIKQSIRSTDENLTFLMRETTTTSERVLMTFLPRTLLRIQYAPSSDCLNEWPTTVGTVLSSFRLHRPPHTLGWDSVKVHRVVLSHYCRTNSESLRRLEILEKKKTKVYIPDSKTKSPSNGFLTHPENLGKKFIGGQSIFGSLSRQRLRL